MNSRHVYSILLLIFCLTTSYGQFGFNVRYALNDFNEWSETTTTFSGGPIWENNLEYAVDYWFRPGDIRMEYSVEGTFGFANTSLGTREYNLNSFGAGIKSNIYIFDFFSDCDCPTFVKDNDLFKKGFFVQWNANAALWSKREDELQADHNNLALDVGAGVGFDIGISELLTVTPYVTYHYYPNVNYDQFNELHGNLDTAIDNQTAVTRLKLGIRIGFRQDYKKEQRILRR